MKLTRVITSGVATACAVLTMTAMDTSSASADTANGCGYPQVCFYKTNADWNAKRWTAAYKDITSSYQTLSSAARGAQWIFNSRNDDGALLHFIHGATVCLGPNQISHPGAFSTVVEKIRIMNDPACRF